MTELAASSPFTAGLSRLSRNLRHATGCRVVWKSADPAHWSATPIQRGQHRHPYCLSVKRDAARRKECMAHDNLVENKLPQGNRPCLRTCPFGVRELLVPIFTAGRYRGCLHLGSWRVKGGANSLEKCPGLAKVQAAGDLAKAAFLPLLSALDAEAAFQKASRDALMAEAVIHIGEHLSARLRAVEVARAADLSVSRFLHRFRDATGETFRRHVERRVMAEACRFLADPHRRVEDIGDALGFRDVTAFVTAFRRVFGSPPGEWRKGIVSRADA